MQEHVESQEHSCNQYLPSYRKLKFLNLAERLEIKMSQKRLFHSDLFITNMIPTPPKTAKPVPERQVFWER